MVNYISGAAIRSPIQGGDSNPKFRRDQLLDDDFNDGVRFLFDLAFPFSYPGGPIENRPPASSPINGSIIYDISEIGNGEFSTSSSGTTYSGGGFDFSGVSNRYHELRGPSSALSSIIASSVQNFSVCFYAKLPTLIDWYSGTGIIPLFCTNGNNQGYAGAPDLLTIGVRSGGQIQAVRSTTAIGSTETRTLTIPDSMAGLVSQVLYYRNGSFTELRLKNIGGTLSALSASGVPSSLNLTECQPRWGVCQALWDFGAKPSLATAKKWRLFRGFLENLETSGRNPIEVADSDYQRVIERGIFS